MGTYISAGYSLLERCLETRGVPICRPVQPPRDQRKIVQSFSHLLCCPSSVHLSATYKMPRKGNLPHDSLFQPFLSFLRSSSVRKSFLSAPSAVISTCCLGESLTSAKIMLIQLLMSSAFRRLIIPAKSSARFGITDRGPADPADNSKERRICGPKCCNIGSESVSSGDGYRVPDKSAIYAV